jgi:hypothetical protein
MVKAITFCGGPLHGDILPNGLLRYIRKAFSDIRGYQSGTNGIHGNSVFHNFPGQSFRKSKDTRFRCGVMGAAVNASAPFTRNRTNINDAAVFMLDHFLYNGLSNDKRSTQIDIHDSVKVCECHVYGFDWLSQASVVDKHVNLSAAP